MNCEAGGCTAHTPVKRIHQPAVAFDPATDYEVHMVPAGWVVHLVRKGTTERWVVLCPEHGPGLVRLAEVIEPLLEMGATAAEEAAAFSKVCADEVESLGRLFPDRRFVLLASGSLETQGSVLTASSNVCPHELLTMLEHFLTHSRSQLKQIAEGGS